MKTQENSKKHIVISEIFHKKLKLRSVDSGTTIEEEIDKILKKEFQNKKKV